MTDSLPDDADVGDLHGVGDTRRAALADAGFDTVGDVRDATPADLEAADGYGPTRAQNLHENATTDGETPNKTGRPRKFDDDRARDALDAAREGKSIRGCARAAGVRHSTMREWVDDEGVDGLSFTDADGTDRDFAVAFRRARSAGESELIDGGLNDDYNPSMAKFLLSSSFGYSDKQEIEHSGEVAHDTDHSVELDSQTAAALRKADLGVDED